MSGQNRPEPQEFYVPLGAALRDARKALDWSLARAAKESGGRITSMTLRSYEAAQRRAYPHTIAEMARLYGRPVAELWPGWEEPGAPPSVVRDLDDIAAAVKRARAKLRGKRPNLRSAS